VQQRISWLFSISPIVKDHPIDTNSLTSIKCAIECQRAAARYAPCLAKKGKKGPAKCEQTCLALFSVGIAAGSALAAWLAKGRILLTVTVAGALIGMFAALLGWASCG
jgi:hypothetical protein